MRRVCIVTDELHPFTSGGIGRLVHNLIVASRERGDAVEFHLLLPDSLGLTSAQLTPVFGGPVHVHYARMRAGWELGFSDEGDLYPPAEAFSTCREHAQSLDFLVALKNLALEGYRFDWIEFPDYRGWAFCTLQEKRLDPSFGHGEVVVRLHGTAGIIQSAERTRLSVQQVALAELERKALLDADRVVAHLAPIAERYARFYGMPPAWLERVAIEFPPVATPPVRPPGVPRDLVFVTKVQTVKRPDLFVRGAALFLRAHPEFEGRVLLACHGLDGEAWAETRRLIPPDLEHRFVAVAGPVRDRVIPGNVVVISSEYESLCLSAYEAAAAGASLVVNRACPAFGPGTPFGDDEVCYGFDGSARGLAEALDRAFRDPPRRAASWQSDAPYFTVPPLPRITPAARAARVSVLITNYNLGRYLPEAIASLAASSHADVEVIVVDDASTDPFDHALLDHVARDGSVTVIRNPVNLGLAASRNVALDAASGDYVMPLDADDCIAPAFMAQAVAALGRHPDFDVVVPQTAFFDSDEELAERRFPDYALFLGDVPSLGLVENRLSSATALMRREVVNRFRYDERLTAFEDWNLYLRMVHAGVRFLATNSLQFFYRRRPRSMVRGVDRTRRYRLMIETLESLPRPLPEAAQPFPLLLPALAHLAGAATDAPSASDELRHKIADRLDESVKRVPYLQPALRRLVLGMARLAGRA